MSLLDGWRVTYARLMLVHHFKAFERWAHREDVPDHAVEVEIVQRVTLNDDDQLLHARI